MVMSDSQAFFLFLERWDSRESYLSTTESSLPPTYAKLEKPGLFYSTSKQATLTQAPNVVLTGALEGKDGRYS